MAIKNDSWLAIHPGYSWLDVGCGTGTLTKLILDRYHPKRVISIDSSTEFIFYSKQTIRDPFVHFQVGLAQSMELESDTMDASVSGLALNFVPTPEAAVSEMIRITKP